MPVIEAADIITEKQKKKDAQDKAYAKKQFYKKKVAKFGFNDASHENVSERPLMHINPDLSKLLLFKSSDMKRCVFFNPKDAPESERSLRNLLLKQAKKSKKSGDLSKSRRISLKKDVLDFLVKHKSALMMDLLKDAALRALDNSNSMHIKSTVAIATLRRFMGKGNFTSWNGVSIGRVNSLKNDGKLPEFNKSSFSMDTVESTANDNENATE